MGLAEVQAVKPRGIADGPIIARQFGARSHVDGGDVVSKGDPERASVRRLRMIEVAPIVPTKDPQLQLAM